MKNFTLWMLWDCFGPILIAVVPVIGVFAGVYLAAHCSDSQQIQERQRCLDAISKVQSELFKQIPNNGDIDEIKPFTREQLAQLKALGMVEKIIRFGVKP